MVTVLIFWLGECWVHDDQTCAFLAYVLFSGFWLLPLIFVSEVNSVAGERALHVAGRKKDSWSAGSTSATESNTTPEVIWWKMRFGLYIDYRFCRGVQNGGTPEPRKLHANALEIRGRFHRGIFQIPFHSIPFHSTFSSWNWNGIFHVGT